MPPLISIKTDTIQSKAWSIGVNIDIDHLVKTLKTFRGE